jgi:hypothetical protein
MNVPTTLFSVREYGAAGDGLQMDTSAIQAAVDACTQAGGGTVLLSAGDYLSGTIILKDNVDLHLAGNARLLGSPDLADYPPLEGAVFEGRCLVHAKNARNISLSGNGVIDGQGSAFPCGAEGFNFEDESAAPDAKTYIRPLLVYFSHCQGVAIRDLTLQHSASWCCHIERCKSVQLNGAHIFNRANQNNDGFDLTDCEDVFAANCKIDCGDDAFALKEGGRNIVITNCVISTRWAAFRVGPEALGVFREIAVSNCVVYNTYGAAIKMQEVEGGVMENILFDNIVMENVTGPISIRLGGYLGWKNERKESLPIGIFRNVQFSNIRARVADNAYPLPHEVPAFPGERKSCININGVPGFYVENVTLSNIHVTFPGGGTLEDAHIDVPELRDHYPEYHMFGTLPAYGLYARHARGLVLNNIHFDYAGKEMRAALVCDDVQDLEVSGLRAAIDPEAECVVRLKDACGAFLHGCRPVGTAKGFLQVEGLRSSAIHLSGNDLQLAARAVTLSAEVPAEGVSER